MAAHVHMIHTETAAGEVPIEVGTRVAVWHQTTVEQIDPVPGTVVSVGAKFITVKWDDRDKPGRIEPRRVTYWAYPPDAV